MILGHALRPVKSSDREWAGPLASLDPARVRRLGMHAAILLIVVLATVAAL